MKKTFFFAVIALFFACTNAKKEKETGKTTADNPKENTTTSTSNKVPEANAAAVTYMADGSTEKKVTGSILVQKDKDKLSPGNENLALVTANGPEGESFVINFLFALKPGIYPVVGLSLSRNEQVFGGILGGQPKITAYKVNLTECTDLGSNNAGGHKWKLSGNVEGGVTIEAMGIMKMQKDHPASIKVNKISFSNLTFDDNWEQILEEGLKKLKENK